MIGLLIAIVAGVTSALMFSSIVSGAIISLLLFYLAPLPLMVAALGWGALTAAVGGIIAAIGLGVLFGFPYLIAFVLSVALPAWWLGHLALLARPVSKDPQLASLTPTLDWYPVGRILVWLAAFASITTMSALLTLGSDEAGINASLRQGLLRIIGGGAADADSQRIAERLVSIAPGAATIIAMMTLTLNLWLAAKVTGTSGRLRRPWPDLRMTTLPRTTMAALVVALGLAFAGGLIAMFAQIVGAALIMAYAVTGYAVLHTITQSVTGRGFILGSTYAATMFVGWPLLGMAGLGLADSFFGIRDNYWRRQPQPPPT